VSSYETMYQLSNDCVSSMWNPSPWPGVYLWDEKTAQCQPALCWRQKGGKEVVLVGNHLVRHMGHGPTFTQPGRQLPKPVGKRF